MGIPDFRRGRALLGFMNQQDAVNFLKGACIIDDGAELNSYQAKWISASTHVNNSKPRFISPPEMRDLPQEQSAYLKELSSQDLFKQIFSANHVVKEVHIGRVVAFQRNIDTEYAGEISTKMRENAQFVLETCLPLKFQQALEVTFDLAVQGITFSSFSPKLVLQGMQITGLGGPEVTIGAQKAQQPGVLFLIGTQANYVQVVEYRARYFLKNGYHRAYAALLSGRKYIPAVVSKVEDFTQVGAVNPSFFSKELLMSGVPPLIEDFQNDEIAVDVKLRPMRKVIRIRVDDFLVPR